MQQEIQPQQFNTVPSNNRNKIILTAASLLVVALVSTAGYFIFSKNSVQPVEIQTQQQAVIVDQKIYRNEQYGFEFKYPQSFLVGKFEPEVSPSSNVPPDIQEKLSDLSLNNAIVLVESEQVALFQNSPKAFSVDSIPIGDVPTISIKPITTSAGFYRRSYIDREFFSESKFSSDYKTKKIQIGDYQVTKLPGYPGPYGDAGYYYLLPISENLIIEFTATREKILTNTEMTESHYDKVIEDIISTFKLTNNFGIVSFTKTAVGKWPSEWHITLSPEDTQNIKGNEFRIVSQLTNMKWQTNEEELVHDVLVDQREIQPEVGDLVEMKFHLNNSSLVNPMGPRGYQYMVLSSAFSRLASKRDEITANSVKPYASSFPIYMLGNKIDDILPQQKGNFVDFKILIATVKTSDDKNSYTYEIFLENFPMK